MRSIPTDNLHSLSNTEFLRRHARRMLRGAHSDRTSLALPVVRRVHAARAVPVPRLTDLFRTRKQLQLKHILRTLATELGYPTWADCKRDVDSRPSAVLDRFRLDSGAFGDFHQIWFSDEAAALRWQQENGGQVVRYGTQAVVMTG